MENCAIKIFITIKKMAHAYLGARIFSKCFGGKIKTFDKGYPYDRLSQSRQFLENI